MAADYVAIGNAILYLGDCLSILPLIGMSNAVVSDPPYGINAKLGYGGMWKDVTIDGDSSTEIRDKAIKAAALPFAIFSAPREAPPPGTIATVVWDKGGHTGLGDLSMPWKPSFELVHIGGRGWVHERRIGGVIQINAVSGCVGNRNDGHRWHPFEKPVAVMEHFISRAPLGAILDPFMGSGTTGVACANLGRKFIGIEIDPKYFEIACQRIEAAYAQGRLFA